MTTARWNLTPDTEQDFTFLAHLSHSPPSPVGAFSAVTATEASSTAGRSGGGLSPLPSNPPPLMADTGATLLHPDYVHTPNWQPAGTPHGGRALRHRRVPAFQHPALDHHGHKTELNCCSRLSPVQVAGILPGLTGGPQVPPRGFRPWL